MARPKGSRNRKPAEVEIIPDEEEVEIAPRTAKRKHTVEMEYVEEVPIDEAGEVITDDDGDELPEIAERKAYVKSERERIREKLKKAGVSSNQPLRLRVDRLPNYKLDGSSGVAAEKAFCFAMDCDENFVTNGEALVMEIQKRCGPGDYWLTVRYKNSVLDQWKETIASLGAPQPIPMADPNNPTGPPQYVYQWPQQQNGAAQSEPIKVPTLKESLKDMVEQKRYLKELMDDGQQPQQAQPIPAFDANAINAEILKTKAFAEGIASILHPEKTNKKSVMELMFEHGADLLEGFGKHVVNPVIGAIERRQQYGSAPEQGRTQERIEAAPQAQSDGSHGADAGDFGNRQANPSGEQGGQQAQAQTPEVQIALYMIDAYMNKVPMRALIGNLRGMAEVNPSLPDMLGGFAEETPENLLQFVGFLRPDLSNELKKPEAVKWISDLQTAINKEWAINEEE